MTRARDVSRLVTTPPNIYATDSEASSGYLTLSSASSAYLLQSSASSTYLNKLNSGLTLITTDSFTNVTTKSINNAFSSTYENYRIMIRLTGQSVTDVNYDFRFRSGITDRTSSYYHGGFYNYINSASLATWAANNTSSVLLGNGLSGSNYTFFILDIFTPYTSSTVTTFTCQSFSRDLTSYYSGFRSGFVDTTTSFDGFSIYLNKAFGCDGYVSIYGYNK